jgi:hypothetical protein
VVSIGSGAPPWEGASGGGASYLPGMHLLEYQGQAAVPLGRGAHSRGRPAGYLFFVHSFLDGRVSRIAAHVTKDAALSDIAARYRGQAWPS